MRSSKKSLPLYIPLLVGALIGWCVIFLFNATTHKGMFEHEELLSQLDRAYSEAWSNPRFNELYVRNYKSDQLNSSRMSVLGDKEYYTIYTDCVYETNTCTFSMRAVYMDDKPTNDGYAIVRNSNDGSISVYAEGKYLDPEVFYYSLADNLNSLEENLSELSAVPPVK